ncbi:MAG: hypothetical protein ACEQSB_01240 [Undibacterium sp.]
MLVGQLKGQNVPNHLAFEAARTHLRRSRDPHLHLLQTPAVAQATGQGAMIPRVTCRRELSGGEPASITLQRAQNQHFQRGLPPCNQCPHRSACAGD